jgi:hypothetical protein
MISYAQRAEQCANPTAKKLLMLMDKKQTNLAIAADVTTRAEILKIAQELGPEICVLKTHIDIIVDFNLNSIKKSAFSFQCAWWVIFRRSQRW